MNKLHTLGGSFLTQSSKNEQTLLKLHTQGSVEAIEEEEQVSQN